jgi:hypothetical protein
LDEKTAFFVEKPVAMEGFLSFASLKDMMRIDHLDKLHPRKGALRAMRPAP